MKNIGKRGKTAKAIAMLLVLCMALCAVLGGCGKDNGKEPAEASENGGKPADTGTSGGGNPTPDVPSAPAEEEDYPPMDMAYIYDGARTLQLLLLNNTETSLHYSFSLEGKTDAGWETVDGAAAPPEGDVDGYGAESMKASLADMPLKEHPDFRILCRYQAEGWSAPREAAAELHFGDKQKSDARQVFGSASDPAWSVDGKGKCMLSFVTEEKGCAWTDGTESGHFSYTLSYADMATIGDKAGAYAFYKTVTPTMVYGEKTEEGAVLRLNTMLGGKDYLRVGAQYDLCLTVFYVTEDNRNTEVLYLTTRVNYTAQDAEVVENSADFVEAIDPPLVVDKPVLYLYPEQETEVTAQISTDGEMTVSWPPYKGGWTVTAAPDGTLTDSEGNEYPYLFYELSQKLTPDFAEGFCVPGEETGEFLRTVLSGMGLTPKEYTDFIVYWLPRMQNNRYNVITFCNEEYAESAELTVTPAPDSLLRICMVYYGSETPVELAPQTFAPFAREGFTAVEWGGSELKG